MKHTLFGSFAVLGLVLFRICPAFAGVNAVDLSVTMSDLPDPVAAGGNLTYTISYEESGPFVVNASNVVMTDTLPAGTTFVSFASPVGWLSTTPAVGGTGTVTATKPSVSSGESGTFTLVVKVDAGSIDGTVITNTATIESDTAEFGSTNNTATTTTTVELPQVSVDDASVTETDAAAVDACFTLSLSKLSPSVVTVAFATADGTATAPDDYEAKTGTATFAAGETSAQVCVSVQFDDADEDDETFFLDLSNPTNATLGDEQGVGTIVDDDAPAAGTTGGGTGGAGGVTTGGGTGDDGGEGDGGCSLIRN